MKRELEKIYNHVGDATEDCMYGESAVCEQCPYLKCERQKNGFPVYGAVWFCGCSKKSK